MIADFIENEYRWVLYQIESFYVEIRYHMEHNILTGIGAFDDIGELEHYLPQIKMHKEYGHPLANLKELRDWAIAILPKETIQKIIDADDTLWLTYEHGLTIRNQLNLWHTKVYDSNGKELHPDDVSIEIIKEIRSLKD